jgi:hypothetical protein
MPENVGYYQKYTVIDNRTGDPVEGRTFTLNLDTDPFAMGALAAYREAIHEDGGYGNLVADLDDILEGTNEPTRLG